MESSGKLALVLQRLPSTSTQVYCADLSFGPIMYGCETSSQSFLRGLRQARADVRPLYDKAVMGTAAARRV